MSVGRTYYSTDLGGLLGLNGRGLLLLYALFSATFVGLSFSAGHLIDNSVEATALALILWCGALLAAQGAYPLPLRRVTAVLILIALSVGAANSQLGSSSEREFDAWHFGAVNFLLFALALRGRIRAAWLGMSVMCTLTAAWSVFVTGNPLYGVGLVYGQTAALAAGTFFAILLRRTATQIRTFNQVERQRVAQEHLIQEGELERARQLDELRALAEGPLLSIARADSRDSDRNDFLLLEGTLRDRIRGRSLCREPLISAVQDARLRGKEVVLLDDLDVDRDIDSSAVTWVATRVASEQGTVITVRISANGQETLLTYVAEGAMPESLRLG